MTEFDYDCLQKKQTARSAFRRVGGRGRVTLPSDHLNPTDLARRSGPCRTYCLGSPMSLSQFEAMPADLQREYLKRLRLRGGSEEAVARMLGTAPETLRRYQIPFDRANPAAWDRFLNHEEE